MNGPSHERKRASSRQRRYGRNQAANQRSAARDHSTDVSMAAKVRFLSRADSYAEHPHRVDMVETHYSWVFLTDKCAYKLKKPVQGVGF
jgi:hypothetical protein